MPRAEVTPELSDTLRSLRTQSKIQSQSLATHIGKSPAYITKLENNNIKSIDLDVLYDILGYLSSDASPIDLAEQIYKTLKIKYSAKEIEDQLWFVNFEEVKCLLPVPESLIDEINALIEELHISRQYLLNRINANEALSEEEKNNPSFPDNQWVRTETKDNGDFHNSVKINLTIEYLDSLLDKKRDISQYLYMRAIVFYLLKKKQFGDATDIDVNQYKTLLHDTVTILNSHKYYSISEKNRIISETRSSKEIRNLMNAFDIKNQNIISDILSGFQVASEQNIKLVNEQLEMLAKNMHWDLGFVLRLISIDYSKLDQISFSLKKELLFNIEELVEKYKNVPKDIKRIENYE